MAAPFPPPATTEERAQPCITDDFLGSLQHPFEVGREISQPVGAYAKDNLGGHTLVALCEQIGTRGRLCFSRDERGRKPNRSTAAQ